MIHESLATQLSCPSSPLVQDTGLEEQSANLLHILVSGDFISVSLEQLDHEHPSDGNHDQSIDM